MTLQRFSVSSNDNEPEATTRIPFALDGHAAFFAAAAEDLTLAPTNLTLATPDRISLSAPTSHCSKKS